jgi:hypothetical protein
LPLLIALPFLLISSLLGAAGVLIVQFLLWLSEGMWVGMSGALLFRSFLPSSNPFVQWLDDPQSWYGAHTLISGTPLFLFLVFITVVLFCAYAVIPESWARRHGFLMAVAVGPAFIATWVWVIFS